LKRNLLDFDADGLAALFGELGEKPFRARQVLKWIHQSGESDFAAMSDLAKGLREKLAAVAASTRRRSWATRSPPTARASG